MSDTENITCIRVPGGLDNASRLRIDEILNKAAGGDYSSHITKERLVDPSTGFTLNDGCYQDLCLSFNITTSDRVALSLRGVEFLPRSSAIQMNPLR